MDSAQTTAAKTIVGMRRETSAESSLFAQRLHPAGDLGGAPGFSDLFREACGGEAAGYDHYRFGIEYIFEGYLLHFGRSRLLTPTADDFSLLAGDAMYARGLTIIAELEDLYCIEALAGLIRRCSYVHCENNEPSRAMVLWALTTLDLAARATGESATASRDAIWGDAGSAQRLAAILDERLSSFPDDQGAALREIFSNIDANFRAEA